MELKVNLHTSRILFPKDSSYKCQFYTKVCALSRLVSKIWARCKDVPTKMLKHDARLKFELQNLKLVSAIFYQIFISHQMIAFQELWKMFFISSKKPFSFSRYLNFCISIFPLFLSVSGWFKRNLKSLWYHQPSK